MIKFLKSLGLSSIIPKSYRNVDSSQDIPSRQIRFGQINTQSPNNQIRTSKYTFWSFIPINLYIQFSNFVNVYFLIISIIQFIPGASPVGTVSNIIPLSAFIFLAMLHEAYDDFRRHQMDHEENNRNTAVLARTTPEKGDLDGISMEIPKSYWKNRAWWELRVGDIIKVNENQWIPADLILLTSSRTDGVCYLETAALDGESNLKKIQTIKPIQDQISDEHDLSRLKGFIDIEEPTIDLYNIVGNLHLDSMPQHPLSIGQTMLRGSILRNTSHVCGIVVYSGEQTKVRLNASRNIKAKIPSINYAVNRAVVTAFALLLLLATLATSFNFQLERQEEVDMWYLGKSRKIGARNTILTFLSFIVLLNTIVPISLFFSLELCKLVQAYFITQDRSMYHEPTNTPAHFHTTVLNDDLGMVEYIFSDKTGTLTENAMHFQSLFAYGINYIHNQGRSQLLNIAEIPVPSQPLQPISSADIVKTLLLNKSVSLTILGMSLCHTVYPDLNEETGDLVYQSTSPDELALVRAAQKAGFVLLDRDSRGIALEIQSSDAAPQRYQIEVLDTIEFTSDRKRMSVIVRFPGASGVVVFSKGADSSMLPLLTSDQSSGMIEQAKNCMHAYSCQGLRTLVFAYKSLSQKEYEAWKKQFEVASQNIGRDRQQKLASVVFELEKDLLFSGATGLEDRLQQGVPETISKLRSAGIKIWVLTGDKRETAINIGRSCSLLSPNSPLVILDVTQNEIKQQMESAFQSWIKGSSIVVDGATFAHLENQGGEELNRFLDLSLKASSVILCRSSPSQKATVVKLMRSRLPGRVTLAIGDGGNDVAMIQEAHVGIGISGNEGLMAARSSDYSIAQFRFLMPLILVHGRWNYFRSSRLILLTFYKVMAFYFSQYIYQNFTTYTGTSWYESWSFSLYNTFYTIFPILVIGVFEQDHCREFLLMNPEVYSDAGPAGAYFNVPLYIGTVITSWIHALLIAGPYFLMDIWTNFDQPEKYPPSAAQMYYMGMSVYWTTVVVVNVWVAILSSHFCTVVHFFFAVLSISIFFLTQLIFSAIYKSANPLPIRGSIESLYGSPQLWLSFLFTIMAVLWFKCLLRLLSIELDPYSSYLRSLFGKYSRGFKISRFFPTKKSAVRNLNSN